jgi:hypothetical protein
LQLLQQAPTPGQRPRTSEGWLGMGSLDGGGSLDRFRPIRTASATSSIAATVENVAAEETADKELQVSVSVLLY